MHQTDRRAEKKKVIKRIVEHDGAEDRYGKLVVFVSEGDGNNEMQSVGTGSE